MKKKKPTRTDLAYIAWLEAKKQDGGKLVLSKDKEANRRNYPELAKIVDEVRRLWPDAKMKITRRSQATPAPAEQDD